MDVDMPSHRLWSLAAHRCLHTFNHHTSSVWALHSTHPSLERFYSGSRDGYLCVVDVEQCTDISDGECVVLAREGDAARSGDAETKAGDEGIRCIVGMDDEFVWSATGSADVKRWRDVGRKITRLTDEDDGVSYNDRPNGEMSIKVPSAIGGQLPPTSITNKSFPLDGVPENQSLLPTDSRDSRSVAFAPPPSTRNGPNPVQQRRATHSGAPIATSFMSDSSANADDGPMPVPAHSLKLKGLPYQSLVCLGLPDSPYSFGFSPRQDELQRARSAVDIFSNPPAASTLLKPDMGDSPHRASATLDREQTLAQMARMEFEDREVASEATPLRKQPDDVIAGRSGLVRSLLLNDRQHVLTVDTEGEVAAWNIIRGVCIGRYSPAEVAAALDLERGVKTATAVRKHSQEVLELVKERVEGETLVITWCQVDTKIGSLVVHLEEGRVFDAEVYADEMGMEGMEGMEGMKEDARSACLL